jgi:hypothetical protein
MATITEEILRLKSLENKGRGNEKCHVVLIEEEAKARAENAGPKPKTRFQWETDTAAGYAELNRGKDRIMRVIENKMVAISVAAYIWNKVSEDKLRQLAEDGLPEPREPGE